MPIRTKAKHRDLIRELNTRFYVLVNSIQSRSLNHPREGAGTGRWSDPDNMIATSGTTTDVNLAIADFKAILTEIGKLK